MIDVRFMVSIVRKEDSSNHSHDHTHDHYHRRPAMSDDSPYHSLPQVSASEHTHDRSHACVSLHLGWIDGAAFKQLGRLDDGPTRSCPVDVGTGLSARVEAHVRVGVDSRSAIKT